MGERTERRLVEKAEYVGAAVALLTAKRDELSFDEYRTDREQRDIVEREFETAMIGARNTSHDSTFLTGNRQMTIP